MIGGSTDFMLDQRFISSMKRFIRPDSSDERFDGLHLKVGVVYEVDKEKLTARVGSDLRQRTQTGMLVKHPTIEAMIIGRDVGMQMIDAGGPEKFCCDLKIPTVGAHVVYAHINGSNTGNGKTVILGTINPQLTAYNHNELKTAIQNAFVTLKAIKYYDSPSGYYEYEDEDGDLYRGFFDHTSTADPKEKWAEVIEHTGKKTYTKYNDTDQTKKIYEEELSDDGSFTMTHYGTTEKKIREYIRAVDGAITAIMYNATEKKIREEITLVDGTHTVNVYNATESLIWEEETKVDGTYKKISYNPTTTNKINEYTIAADGEMHYQIYNAAGQVVYEQLRDALGNVTIENKLAGATNAKVKLNASGQIDVTSKVPALLKLNSGVQGVARMGDTVTTTVTPADIVNLATALLATGAFTPTGSPPAPPPTPVPLTGGVITSASTSVQAG